MPDVTQLIMTQAREMLTVVQIFRKTKDAVKSTKGLYETSKQPPAQGPGYYPKIEDISDCEEGTSNGSRRIRRTEVYPEFTYMETETCEWEDIADILEKAYDATFAADANRQMACDTTANNGPTVKQPEGEYGDGNLIIEEIGNPPGAAFVTTGASVMTPEWTGTHSPTAEASKACNSRSTMPKYSIITYQTNELTALEEEADKALNTFICTNFPVWRRAYIRRERADQIDRILGPKLLRAKILNLEELSSAFKEIYWCLFDEELLTIMAFPRTSGQFSRFGLYTGDIAYVCARVQQELIAQEFEIRTGTLHRVAQKAYNIVSPLPYEQKQNAQRRAMRKLRSEFPCFKWRRTLN